MIDKYKLKLTLEKVVGDYLKSENVSLVDFNFKTQGRKFILRILVDEPEGGITLDRCAYLNSAITQLLDTENLIYSDYILELSSPGLDRPLVTRDDFARCRNQKVKIFLRQCEGQEQRDEVSGIIVSVSETAVNIDLGDKVQIIPFNRIRKAKQLIEVK